jgi:hypothetical protein
LALLHKRLKKLTREERALLGKAAALMLRIAQAD